MKYYKNTDYYITDIGQQYYYTYEFESSTVKFHTSEYTGRYIYICIDVV